MNKNIKTLLIVSISLLTQMSFAQYKKKNDELFSKELNEMRNLQIVFPNNYNDNSNKKYNVIYVLDGESITKLASQIQQQLANWKSVPNAIIVGVKNTYINKESQRNRDFLPTHVGKVPISGKADSFLKFIKNELMPYINENYPVTDYNILFGHSFGGTFAVYALLKEPALFNAYVVADPALWWDNNYLISMSSRLLPKLTNSKTSLHIAGREGTDFEKMGITSINKVLDKKAPKNLHWKSTAYTDETHITVILKSLYDGLKFSYKN